MSSTRPTTRERGQIPERYRWDLSHICPDWEQWQDDLGRLQRLMDSYHELKGTLDQGPQQVLAASRLSDELGQLAYRVYQYPGLKLSEDTRDNQIQARLERVRIALAKFQQDVAWYTPELLAIPEQQMRRWLDESAELEQYRFPILETFRKHRHVLDEEGERLLAFAGPFNHTPSHTYTMMAEADVRFPEVELEGGDRVVASHANYLNGLQTRRLQADREALFRGHFSVFDSSPNVYAAIYHGVLQRDWFIAQGRRYSSTLEAALDEDNIPVDVVKTLIATAKAGVEPLRRYHRLRRRVLGLDRYRYFDAYLPLLEVDWALPYDEVAPLVEASVAIFGDEYQRAVGRSFAERWIDVYENEGKRSGAFSAGVYGVHPYLLLNHADTLTDAFTLAHEMGHAMHTMLAHAHQPYATSSYSIFVAEVASMTGEELLRAAMLGGEPDPGRQVVLLQHAIDDIAASFYRQAMFADFELEAHRSVERGEPITAETLQQLYLRTLRDFFGTTLDDQAWYRNGWARIPHFFGSPYYVFQYATSKAAASLLYRRMTTGSDGERQDAVRAYLELLSSGGNDHPIEQLKRAGVDLTTSEPVEGLVATMNELVDRLAGELKGMGVLSS